MAAAAMTPCGVDTAFNPLSFPEASFTGFFLLYDFAQRALGLLKELTKAVLERASEAEMTAHLGYEKHDPAGHHRGNTRNGKSRKI
jgi:predicted amidohydrolase